MGGESKRFGFVTVAFKEEMPIAGHSLTYGSLAFRDQTAATTHVVAQRIFQAGAIMHARTTTPEFSCAGICHNRLWGITLNPWNLEFSSGGSSGGSGAALAAGMAPLATESDIAGSIRIPASACGVVGFKPPYGRVPQGSIFNLDYYCHTGPMARTVEDCAMLQNAMAGPDPSDNASLKPKYVIPEELGDIRGWRIALSMDLGYFRIDPEVEKNTLAAAEKLRDAGAVVVEVSLAWTEESLSAANAHLGHIFGNSLAPYLRDHREDLTPYAIMLAEYGAETSGEDFVDAMRVAGEMNAALQDVFRTYRCLICPTLTVPSLPADFDVTRKQRLYGWLEVTDPVTVSWCLTYPFNMLSRCPVLSVPSGLSGQGVPTGLQIVGQSYEDTDVFRIGKALQDADPWYGYRRPRL